MSRDELEEKIKQTSINLQQAFDSVTKTGEINEKVNISNTLCVSLFILIGLHRSY